MNKERALYPHEFKEQIDTNNSNSLRNSAYNLYHPYFLGLESKFRPLTIDDVAFIRNYGGVLHV